MCCNMMCKSVRLVVDNRSTVVILYINKLLHAKSLELKVQGAGFKPYTFECRPGQGRHLRSIPTLHMSPTTCHNRLSRPLDPPLREFTPPGSVKLATIKEAEERWPSGDHMV